MDGRKGQRDENASDYGGTVTSDLRSRIKADILKSGFPLELHLIEECQKRDWSTLPNRRYNHEGEQYEVDLSAEYEVPGTLKAELPHLTYASLHIEAKKSKDKPWVFFSSPAYESHRSLILLKHNSTLDDMLRGSKSPARLIFQIEDGVKSHHYLDESIPRCISYCEAFKNPSNRSDIYDAIQSVVRFTEYEMNEWEGMDATQSDAITVFYYPTVVLDGELFEAVVEGGNIEVVERNHIQLTVSRPSPSFPYIIDFVKKDYFGTLLETIARNHDDMSKMIPKLDLPSSARERILRKYRGGG